MSVSIHAPVKERLLGTVGGGVTVTFQSTLP